MSLIHRRRAYGARTVRLRLRLVTSQGSPYPSRSSRAHPSAGWTSGCTKGLALVCLGTLATGREKKKKRSELKPLHIHIDTALEKHSHGAAMPKQKSGPRGSGGQQPRPAAPKKRATKRPEQTSPKKGTGSKRRAVEPSGDGDAPAPAPAAARGDVLMKRCGKCAACRSRQSPMQPCSAPVPQKKNARNKKKPAKANEVSVTLSATILTSKGEKKSVPVPDDALKRSVRVVHGVRLRRKSGETPEELLGRGWVV